MSAEFLAAAVAGMRAARPAAVYATLRAALRAQGLDAVLWLVDYRQVRLRALDDVDVAGEGVRELAVQDSWQGRVFASQRPGGDPEGAARGVPVSNRGHRLGVLEVRDPDGVLGTGDEAAAALIPVASALAAEIVTVQGSTDHFQAARRSRALTLAAEIQWSLLPPLAHEEERYALAGLLEPAYSIAGDAFDWACDADRLVIAVCDGLHRGVPAAQAASLCISALRNARRAGLSLADQAALADQALYAHYGGASYVCVLLVQLDTLTGRGTVVDAGSPQLWRVRGGEITRVELDAQLPLGMFEETHYVEQPFAVEPGDRLVIVSDGVHGAAGTAGTFGEAAFLEALRGARLLGAAETTRHLIQALHAHHAATDLDDDAVVVCLDWTG